MRPFLPLVASVPLVALALACAPGPQGGPRPIEVPAQPPGAAEEEPTPPIEVVSDIDPLKTDAAAPTPFPRSWAPTYGHLRPHAEAIATARLSRAGYAGAATAVLGAADGGVPQDQQFERVSALLDRTSRQYAAAYHAPDATPANKIEVLAEAAAMIFDWSRRLDEAGLGRAPASYRSSSAIALTYEDVATGPAKRWRDEGVALVQVCTESARASQLVSPATKECARLRQLYSRVVLRKSADAGAHPCACDFGDPLCSASMSGWCHPK